MKQGIKGKTEKNRKIKDRIEKINQGIVPEGYKQTKVGIVPEEWKVKKLSEVSHVYGGESVPRNRLGEVGHPYLHYGDIHSLNSYYINIMNDLDKYPKYNKEISVVKNGCLLEDGDVVFADASEDYEGIGKHIVVQNRNDIPFIAGLHTMIAKSKDNLIDNDYKIYLFQNSDVRKQFMFYATGTSVLGITLNNIRKIRLPIPSNNEQQKIADVLSAWDQAIELKESLIEKKEEQKKGFMKKLISSNEKWNTFKLGEVLFNRSETGYPELELIAVTREKGIVKRDELDRKDTSSTNKDRYKLVLPNDIAYNTMRMWQGVSGISNYRGIVSPAYTVLKPNTDKIDPLFTAYMFKLKPIINIFRRYSQGLVKDTLNLKYTNFSKIKLKFPSLSEQKRIAEILSTADREIDLLKELVEQLKEEKKGLMQLLLTGIVRVKGDDDV